MVQLGVIRSCVACGQRVEWSLDRAHRVVLVEATSRAGHVCPRRALAVLVPCRCGQRITTYADGAVEEWPSGKTHLCQGVWASWNTDPAAAS